MELQGRTVTYPLAIRSVQARNEDRICALQKELDRMSRTRSWRWSAPLRHLGSWMNAARFFLRSCQRKASAIFFSQRPEENPINPRKTITDAVTVIIPCHNYGRFLRDAVESVLRQTLRPRNIIIVDDASTDETPSIAAQFQEEGVLYVRGDWKDVSSARNAGAAYAHSAFLLFLDADDFLPPDYIRTCMKMMEENPRTAIVYGNLKHFGESEGIKHMPEFDRVAFNRMNFIASHALLRRQAFDLAGGFTTQGDIAEDWDLYRRILRYSFEARKANTTVPYRVHAGSRSHRYYASPAFKYGVFANVHEQQMTIFTHFRKLEPGFDKYVDALRNLACNGDSTFLHWYTDSEDPALDERLRDELARLPFAHASYSRVKPPVPSPAPTSLLPYNLTLSSFSYHDWIREMRAYHLLLQTCATDLIFILRDNIAPAPDVLNLMLDSLSEETAAVIVSHGHDTQNTVMTALPDETDTSRSFDLCCTLLRTEVLRAIPLYPPLRCGTSISPFVTLASHIAAHGRIAQCRDARIVLV